MVNTLRITLLAVLLARPDVLRAEVLFSDDFDDASAWTGKNGGRHSAIVVDDPVRQGNSVITFTSLATRGDIFSPEIPVRPGSQYQLEFEYLGVPGQGIPGHLGGFVGFADDASFPGGQHVWLEGTGEGGQAINTSLVDDGTWKTYQIEFDPFDSDQLALPDLSHPFVPTDNTIRIILEDFADSVGVPGDAFFDNIRVLGPEPVGTDGPTTVDGIAFEKFVDIPKPVGIAFDENDNLYVGNGVGTRPDQIRFVPADGSTVIALGPLIRDPDFVVVDTEGHIADEGSVIVGGSPLLALDPVTGNTSTVLGNVGNIFELHIDDQGTLFVGQYTGVAEILRLTGGVAEKIITIPNAGSPKFTFESPNSLLVLTNEEFTVRRYDLSNLNAPTVLGTYEDFEGLGDIRFAERGNFANTVFMTTVDNVYKIDQQTGEAKLFALGFDLPVSVNFDRRGKMFISNEGGDAIYTLCSPWLPGDATKDGAVGFDDFLFLSANFNQEGTWAEGDFNCDGQTTFEDFLILADNFGESLDSQVAAVVPEPSGMLLILPVLVLVFYLGRVVAITGR